MKNEFNNTPVIDMALGTKLAGNKPELAQELLTMFVNRLQDDFIAIEASFMASNYPALCKQIHKLHGAVSYCGLPRLKEAAATLEAALKKNHADRISILFEEFAVEVRQVLEQSKIFF